MSTGTTARDGNQEKVAMRMRSRKRLQIGSGKEKRIRVVLRYDDYSSHPARRDFDQALVRILSNLEVPCTFGVVPYVCAGKIRDPSDQQLIPLRSAEVETIRRLIETGQIELAQHGYSHQTAVAAARPGEFLEMPLTKQLDRIRRGKDHLECLTAVKVTTFIPPWNAYDSNTLKAIEQCGFSTLSARWSALAVGNSPLKFLPHTCVLRKLQQAMNVARLSPDREPVVIAAFHSFDFAESGEQPGWITLDEFVELIDGIKRQDGVEFCTLGALSLKESDLGATHLHNLQSLYRLEQRVPLALRSKAYDFFYPSVSGLASITRRAVAVTAAWFVSLLLLVTLLVLGANYTGLIPTRSVALGICVAAAMASCIVVAWAGRDGSIGYRGAAVATMLAGTAVALIAIAR